MAQCPHPQPYPGLALPQLGLGGAISRNCNQRGPQWSPQTTTDLPNNRDFLCPPSRQISGKYEELRVQYPYQQPYSGFALSQLGQGGQSQTPVTQDDPIRAPNVYLMEIIAKLGIIVQKMSYFSPLCSIPGP